MFKFKPEIKRIFVVLIAASLCISALIIPSVTEAASSYKNVYVLTTMESSVINFDVSYNSNGLLNHVLASAGETPKEGEGKWKYN